MFPAFWQLRTTHITVHNILQMHTQVFMLPVPLRQFWLLQQGFLYVVGVSVTLYDTDYISLQKCEPGWGMKRFE